MRVFKVSCFMLFLGIFLAGCISIPIGDGNKLKLSQDGITISDKDGNKQTIAVEEENIKMTGTDANGEERELSLGTGSEIPESFPKEIFIPDDATIRGSYSISEGSGYLSYVTNIKPAELAQRYEKSFKSDYFTGEIITQDIYGEYIHFTIETKIGVLTVLISEISEEGGSYEVELTHDTQVDIE